MPAIDTIFTLMIIICAIGWLISTMEYMVVAEQFVSGVYSWDIARVRPVPSVMRIPTGILDHWFNTYDIRWLLLVRLILLVSLVALPISSPWHWAGCISLLSVEFIFYWRRLFGDDGSDQMNLQILLVFCLTLPFIDNQLLKSIGLVYVTIQLTLSYFVAGVAKLCGLDWRDGTAITKIFSTSCYGNERFVRMLTRFCGLSKMLAWSVIAFEVLFPLTLCFGSSGAIVGMVVAGSFHLMAAITMGLNSFVWAFFAAFPAYYYTACLIETQAPWLS